MEWGDVNMWIFSNKCGDNLRISLFKNYGKIEWLF